MKAITVVQRRLTTTTSFFVVLLLALAAPAQAQQRSGLERSAQRFGDALAASVGAILTALLAAFGLRAFVKRDWGDAVGLLLMGLLVGFFAFSPADAKQWLSSTANRIFA